MVELSTTSSPHLIIRTGFCIGFLDLPPDKAQEKLCLYGIDPDYYLAVPDEMAMAAVRVVSQAIAEAAPN